MATLERAIEIAISAHKGQVDKGGHPYILHPLRVMIGCYTETEMICGVLHDVIEDTGITLRDLANEGFSTEILEALDSLTRRKDETYDGYIDRILENEVASEVKLRDLWNNINLSRIPHPTDEDLKRQKKYIDTYGKIMGSFLDKIKEEQM